MMTLIALAITVAFVFSAAATLGHPGTPLWEELATLVTIHASRSPGSRCAPSIRRRGPFAELAKLLPSNAVRVDTVMQAR